MHVLCSCARVLVLAFVCVEGFVAFEGMGKKLGMQLLDVKEGID